MNKRKFTTYASLLLLLLSSGCANWRINGFRKMIIPPGGACGNGCCHGSPLCFGHFQTCWRPWPKECGPCAPPSASQHDSIPVAEQPPPILAPMKATPVKMPPMKIEDDEPAPVVDPANEALPEKLPESETLPRGTQNPPKMRGSNVKNWFTTAPLGSR